MDCYYSERAIFVLEFSCRVRYNSTNLPVTGHYCRVFIQSCELRSVGMKKWRKLQAVMVFCIMLAIGMGSATFVCATEGGGGAYPNGAEDFMAGAVPPPGTYFINYLTHYTAGRLNDRNGDKLVPDFRLNATANVFRFIHVTKHQILGGYWGMHVFVPLVHLDVKMMGAKDNKTGLGDIIIDPFILSWHSKNWHFATGVDIYLPTGAYDKNDLANIGRNYWTFEPIFAATYTADCGFDASVKLMYDFNTRNNNSRLPNGQEVKYLSGQEFHLDYTLGYKTGGWSFGVGGYYYKQITNDEVNGEKVGTDGFRGQAFAFGPQVKYDYKNMSFALKYQHEVAVKNRPEGDKFWLKFVYAF